MNDKIQAMVKKVALISLGGVLQQDDLSIGAAGWLQLCRLACSVQEVGHGRFPGLTAGTWQGCPPLNPWNGSAIKR